MEPEIVVFLRENRPDLLEEFYRLASPPVEYEHLRRRHDELYRVCELALSDGATLEMVVGAAQRALYGEKELTILERGEDGRVFIRNEVTP